MLHGLVIWRDLPWFVEADEPIFAKIAIQHGVTHDFNPRGFGNPASTTHYPLGFLYKVWFAIVEQGSFFSAEPRLATAFETNRTPFYLIGRLLSTTYNLASIGLTFIFGRMLFNSRIGLAAAALFASYQLVIDHAPMVRSDTAGTFFGLLALIMLLRFYRRPGWSQLTLFAGSVGLAAGSRYFMVMLIPSFVLLTLLLKAPWRKRIGFIIAGGLLMLVAFFATSPYVFLDFDTFVADVLLEARDTNVGFDGLGPLGNLRWYLVDAMPRTLGWAQVLLVWLGAALLLARKEWEQRGVLLFAAMFMAALCSSALHWERWLIQILPLFALCVAYSAEHIATRLAKPLNLHRSVVFGLVIALVSIVPVFNTGRWIVERQKMDTRIVARFWIEEHISAEAKLSQDQYAAPLDGLPYDVDQLFYLAERPYESYVEGETDYFVASSYMYNRFWAEPDRYQSEIAFYERLDSDTELVHVIENSAELRGPTIKIYRVTDNK